MNTQGMAVQLAKSSGKATHRLCSCTIQLVPKLPAGLIDVILALVYLASFGNRQQQRRLSQQMPGKPTVWPGKGALREQRILSARARFRSIQSLSRTFSTCTRHLKGYLRTYIGYSSNGSASKCQENRLLGCVRERCKSNESRPLLLRFSQPKACPRSPSNALRASMLLSELRN